MYERGSTQPYCDARGIKVIAKPGYTLPMKREGELDIELWSR